MKILKETDKIKKFEEETGRRAIWKGAVTEYFLKWLRDPENFFQNPDNYIMTPEMKQFEQTTKRRARYRGVITDEFKAWIEHNYPHLTHRYPPLKVETIRYQGVVYKVHNAALVLRDKAIKDITEIEGLDKLSELRFLNLSQNQIIEIKGLENLRNLKELYLNHNQIKEINGLENVILLRHLELNNNQITEIKRLENLNSLEHLELNNNQITEIKGLKKLTSLFWLKLNNNPILKIEDINEFPINLELINMYPNSLSEDQYRKIYKKFSIPDEDHP